MYTMATGALALWIQLASSSGVWRTNQACPHVYFLVAGTVPNVGAFVSRELQRHVNSYPACYRCTFLLVPHLGFLCFSIDLRKIELSRADPVELTRAGDLTLIWTP